MEQGLIAMSQYEISISYRKVWLLSAYAYTTSEEWIYKLDIVYIKRIHLINEYTIKLIEYRVNAYSGVV